MISHNHRQPNSGQTLFEWQSFGSFSPDGRLLAIGSYPGPNDRPMGPYGPDYTTGWKRPAQMVVIDTMTGRSNVVAGTFNDFAEPPAWTSDQQRVFFGAPIDSLRRLYGFALADMSLDTWKFRRSPAMPMLDVSGILTIPPV